MEICRCGLAYYQEEKSFLWQSAAHRLSGTICNTYFSDGGNRIHMDKHICYSLHGMHFANSFNFHSGDNIMLKGAPSHHYNRLQFPLSFMAVQIYEKERDKQQEQCLTKKSYRRTQRETRVAKWINSRSSDSL
jgi:hypothetical protein